MQLDIDVLKHTGTRNASFRLIGINGNHVVEAETSFYAVHSISFDPFKQEIKYFEYYEEADACYRDLVWSNERDSEED